MGRDDVAEKQIETFPAVKGSFVDVCRICTHAVFGGDDLGGTAEVMP
jgi:hypothetical protein